MNTMRAEEMSPPAPDVAPWHLADSTLRPQDVIEVRLPVSVRGYRFAETDLLLDRLTEELRVRDEQISALRAELEPAPIPAAVPEPDAPVEPAPDFSPDAAESDLPGHRAW